MKKLIFCFIFIACSVVGAWAEGEYYDFSFHKTVWHIEIIRLVGAVPVGMTPEKALEKRMNDIELKTWATLRSWTRLDNGTEHWFQLDWSERVGYGKKVKFSPVNMIMTGTCTPTPFFVYPKPTPTLCIIKHR